MQLIVFFNKHRYIIFTILLIPFIVTMAYLNVQVFKLQNETEYIKRCLFIHSTYVSFFIFLFSILLAISLKETYNKTSFVIRIILKVILLICGIVYTYVFLGFTIKLLSEPDVATKRLYEYFIAILTGLSLSLGFYFNAIIIPFKKKINKLDNDIIINN